MMSASVLAGCFDDNGPADPGPNTAGSGLNLWQAGLANHYPTPDHVETRSGEGREANMAPPGDPEFAAFDAAITAWMEDNEVPAGQFAVIRDGQLRYTSGYGYTNRDETQPTNSSTMFRIASITKIATAAVIHLQIEQGLYNLTDPVFCVPPDPAPDCRLPIEPHPNRPIVDDRLAHITVQHLLEHTGGWDRDKSGDTTWLSFGVAEDLGIKAPPEAWQFAQWVMGQELDYDPGSTEVYSNLGYALAGLVAEAATETELPALYSAYLFRPLEVEGDIEPGRTLPEDRNVREPFYHCSHQATNVYNREEEVCAPDGGWSLEAQLAHGGLIATAGAVAALAEVYGHMGTLTDYPPGPASWYFQGGSMPGTLGFTADVADGEDITGELQFAYLFNKRQDADRCDLPPPAGGEDGPFCNPAHLESTMMELSEWWAAADQLTP